MLQSKYAVALNPRSFGGVVREKFHLLVNGVFVVLLWSWIGWRRRLFRRRLLVIVPNKVHLPRRRREAH